MKSRSPTKIDIFNAALELDDPVQRERYLADICAGNSALRTRLDALLDAHGRGVAMFEPLAPTVSRLSPELAAGDRIGPYRVIEKLGEGGCGVVWVAEQQQPLRRRVALKIIKAGMDTRAVITRFEAERQALALMDHSNIAKVFDAGSTEAGRPYFVMELVNGLRITDYCVQHNLSVRERLNLFLQVCDAVQHAHQKGIIHRDLKPSNILVQTLSATSSQSLLPSFPSVQHSASPKIIDFGIAKAIEGKLTDQTIHTALHQFIGTPAYMSPEQADLSPDIDTRTDIYSLGVLLYELLTGKPPFDNHELLTAGLDEMRRIIREVEPQRPSQAARVCGQKKLSTLHSSLSTDLDCIILKSLEKDRARRYQTSSALAEDIRRYLENKTVSARFPSLAYTSRKFIRRNKAVFGATAAAAVVMIVATAFSLAQAWRATRAEQRANQQALLATKSKEAEITQRQLAERRLNATLVFVDRLFRDIDSKLWQIAGTAEVGEMLATNGLAFLQQIQDSTESASEFRNSLGAVYVRLAQSQGWDQGNTTADYPAALERAEQAIRLLAAGADSTLQPESIRQLVRAELIAGTASKRIFRFQEAIEHFHRAEHWATLLTNHPSFGSACRILSAVAPGLCLGDVLLHMGHVEEAHTNCFLPCLRTMEASRFSEEDPDVFELAHLYGAHACVARTYTLLDRHKEALPHRKEALRLMELVSRIDPNAAEFLCALPLALAELGESLLACNDADGLKRLEQAQQSANALVARDNRSASFGETHVEVLRLSASAFTYWAAAPGAPTEQISERLASAHEYMRQADEQVARLTSEFLRGWLGRELDRVRSLLAAAERKAASEKPPEHRPPASPEQTE